MFNNKTHFKIYLTIITVLVSCIFVVGFSVFNKYALDKEVKNVVGKSLENDNFKVSVKSWFNYGKVEKAVKLYMKDYSDNVKIINNILNDSDIKNILSYSNLKKDGPAFTNSISLLNKRIKEFNRCVKNLNELNSDDKIMEYINKYDLDKKYVDLYKNYMFSESISDLENNKLVIDKLENRVSVVLNTDLAVITLLRDNPSSWVIKDNNIGFYSVSVKTQYDEYIKLLQK